MIQDSTFVCNTRQMYDAYNSHLDVYMMNYWFGFKAAKHASDLLPTFWDGTSNIAHFLEKYLCLPDADKIAGFMKFMAPTYQSYLADLATSGDPNKHQKERPWKTAIVSADGNSLENVLLVQTSNFFQPDYTDPLNTHDICAFWTDVSANITRQLHKIESLQNKQNVHPKEAFMEL